MGVSRSHHPAGLVAVLALALGGTGCLTGDQHEGIPISPVIRTFVASPGSIAPGGTTTLSWSVTGATSLAIDNGVGDVTGTTSKVVSPTTTTTYTLTATSAAASSTAIVTVTVGSTPVISSFTANPTSINSGQGSTLSWTVTGATSLSIDNGVGVVTGTASTVVSPTATTTYVLTATGSGGATATASVTVTVAVAPVISSFAANPTSINSGQGSTLSWTVTGATSLSIDNGVGDVTGTASKVVSPTTTTTYVLTATGSGGATATASVTVTVAAAPVISSFTASPGSINSGQSSTLSWTVTGATSLSIDNGVGDVTGTASKVVSPTTTATYVLTATGAGGGPVTASVTVTVGSGPVISSFTASPGSINSGQSSTLSWTVTGATSLSIDNGIGDVTGTTSRIVSPTTTTPYTLTATAGGSSVVATATVTVSSGPPSGLVYSANPVTYAVLSPIVFPNTPSSSGGAIASYSVNPALPQGLTLDTVTGVITGTPQVEAVRADYTITGSNPPASVTAVLSLAVVNTPTAPGFTSTGSMSVGRRYHTATLLRDGRVLVVGGSNGTAPLRTAEIYDPASGTFATTVGSMATARQSHSATLLADGRVFVAGGVTDSAGTTTATAEVFDPVSGRFSSTLNNMAESRSDLAARTLPDGRVLVAGGFVRFPTALYLATAAIYDPSTNRFTATGSLTTPRAGPLSVLLPGGTVLVTGGKSGAVYLASAEIYDPSTGIFTATSSMSSPRVADTVTMLQVAGAPPAAAGNVLFAGGFSQGYLNTADLYDPGFGTFSATSPMGTHRGYHTAALLPNGQVLLAGGTDGVAVLRSAEFFDPVLGNFVPATGQDMNSARWTHTATELQDGRVLVVGGADDRSITLATAEIWTNVP